MNENAIDDIAKRGTGWKPIPLPLKILFVVFILWLIGSMMNLPNLFENGLPFFGNFVYGMTAAFIVLLLDIIGPVTFLFALWRRKSWAPKWALAYISIFILNGVVALFTVREVLGFPQILVPIIASTIFLVIIYWQRNYFQQSPNSR